MSIYLAILNAVRDRIRALNLAEIPESQVVVVKVFVPEVIEALPGLPAVVICPPARGEINDAGGTNERDDIGYPVQVTLLAEDGQENDEGVRFDRNVAWQQQIRQALTHCPLPEAGCVFTSRLESQHVIDPFPWKRRNLWSGSLVFRFISREERVAT
jgi:hypothetical protein